MTEQDAFGIAAEWDFDEARFAVAGDWNGDGQWIRKVMMRLTEQAPDVRTLVQLGDFFPGQSPLTGGSPQASPAVVAADEAACDAGVERVLVMLGNHAPWPWFRDMEAPMQVAQRVWVLPRVHRMRIGGRVLLSVDGAASVDEDWRTPGVNWWADERVRERDVAAAIAGGYADVLLTHDTIADTPVKAVRRIIERRDPRWGDEALARSAAGRELLQQVLDGVGASWAIHGHMHVAGGGVSVDGKRVTSLANEHSPGNALVVDAGTLTAEAISTYLAPRSC